MSDFSVGICVINLHIPDSRSLKSKRSVVKSLKDRIKNQYPVSIAEIPDNDLWQRVDLALAQINGSSAIISKTFESIIQFIESNYSVSIVDFNIEML
jgi:uncharacterized protein